jgi:hypothetical protein
MPSLRKRERIRGPLTPADPLTPDTDAGRRKYLNKAINGLSRNVFLDEGGKPEIEILEELLVVPIAQRKCEV